jgi:hypothetical protein
MTNEDLQIGAEYSFLGVNTKRKLVDFPVNKIVVNIARNNRDEQDTYDPEFPEMKKLINDMKVYGYLPGQEVLLHQNAVELNGNTDVEAILGHRRSTAAKYAELTTIPAILISGLNEEQKKALIVEPDRVKIKKIGEFKAVQSLVGKMGDQRIADRVGIKKNAVQDYRFLHALPLAAQELWRSYARGNDIGFPFGRPAIQALHAAMIRDWEGKTLSSDGTDVTSGRLPNRDANGGPEYFKALDKLKNEGVPPATTVSKKSVKALATGIKDATIRGLLLAVAEEPGTDITKSVQEALDITGRMQNLLHLEVKSVHLRTLINFPETSSPSLDEARMKQLVELIEDALDAYVNTGNDPMIAWVTDDAHKPKFITAPSEPVSGYEGALPPIDVEVNPNPEMIKVTSEAGVTSEVRADNHSVVTEPEAVEPEAVEPEAVEPEAVEPEAEVVPVPVSGSKKTAKSRK